MFCPILWLAKPEVDIGLSSEHDCLKEKCAWWDDPTQHCTILTLAVKVDQVRAALASIHDKMPVSKY